MAAAVSSSHPFAFSFSRFVTRRLLITPNPSRLFPTRCYARQSKGLGRFRAHSSSSMASESKDSPTNNPGLHATPDDATKGYTMQQTMLRIKDPKESLDFYSRVLGMSILDQPRKIQLKELYGLSVRKLTHNWGTETDPDFKGYHNGNNEPRGFGHIGITVDDTFKACERFKSLGVEFVKTPDSGKMKGIAFIKDPDGYWIEIFDLKNITSVASDV